MRAAIVDGDFYWASPSSFNDPFDCAPFFEVPPRQARKGIAKRVIKKSSLSLTPLQRKAEIKRLSRISTSELQGNLSGMQPFLNETAIFSLTESPDDILMWSHYADSHHGICLEFDSRILLSQYPTANPVHYQDVRPIVRIGIDQPRDLIDKMLLTKSCHWEYEQEWRAFDYRGLAGLRRFDPPTLTAVILGGRIVSSHERFIRRAIAARTKPIQIYRAEIDPRIFRVNILPDLQSIPRRQTVQMSGNFRGHGIPGLRSQCANLPHPAN